MWLLRSLPITLRRDSLLLHPPRWSMALFPEQKQATPQAEEDDSSMRYRIGRHQIQTNHSREETGTRQITRAKQFRLNT